MRLRSLTRLQRLEMFRKSENIKHRSFVVLVPKECDDIDQWILDNPDKIPDYPVVIAPEPLTYEEWIEKYGRDNKKDNS